MTEQERVKLEIDDAIAMLPDEEIVHTFRGGRGLMIGVDWDKEDVIERIKEFGCELSGAMATAMKHGIVLEDNTGYLFIETDNKGVEK